MPIKSARGRGGSRPRWSAGPRPALDDFYRGEIGAANAAELARVGSPVTAADLASHRAVETAPLSVALRCGTVYNVPFPTQGLASLLILGIFDRLGCAESEGFPFVHGLVESTKQRSWFGTGS